MLTVELIEKLSQFELTASYQEFVNCFGKETGYHLIKQFGKNGCNLFRLWQTLDRKNRQALVDYLNRQNRQ